MGADDSLEVPKPTGTDPNPGGGEDPAVEGAVGARSSRDSDTGPGSGGSGGEVLPPIMPGPAAPRRPGLIRTLAIGSAIAIALVIVLFVGLRPHSSKGSAGPVVPIGSQAPEFSLPPLTGAALVDLDALGKNVHHPVILNFFASWCTPCQKETPLLARAAAVEEAKAGPVRFVGIDVNDPPADALSFVQKTGINYPVGVDQTFRVTSGLYGLNGLPQTFFIDSHGKVLGHTIGAVDAAGLRSWMQKLDKSAS